MIEKKIHYIWFGGKKPEKVLKCIESWKKILPNYELIEWNEETFHIQERIKENRFLRECYQRKLWAFLSDYIRVEVLYRYGGIYLDTDMEIIRDITPLLDCNLFLGLESETTMSFGIVGVIPGHEVFKQMYDFYQREIWTSPKYIITDIFTSIMKSLYGTNQEHFIEKKIFIYPREFFYPFGYREEFSQECITANTYGIHWWGKSWKKNAQTYFLKYKHFPWWKKYPKYICRLLGIKLKNLYGGVENR